MKITEQAPPVPQAEIERRYPVGTVELRADGDGATNDVVVLLNHHPNIILGRTSAGTAKIGIDEVGIWYEATLPDSPNGHNARTAIERGDVKQSSWAKHRPRRSRQYKAKQG